MIDLEYPTVASPGAPAVDERRRIAELSQLDILDTLPEERFDRITRLAAMMFDVPTALISFIDDDRQWFKARVGFNLCETSRTNAFCAHTLAHDRVFCVEDAQAEIAFRDNALVVDYPHIGFYAGCAIRGPGGQPVGSLCVIDQKPRAFHKKDEDILIELAALVEAELTTRDRLRGKALDRLHASVQSEQVVISLSDETIHRQIDGLLSRAAKTGRRLALLHLRVDNLSQFRLVHDAGRAQRFISRWLHNLQAKNADLLYIAWLSATTFVCVLDYNGSAEAACQRCDALRAQALQEARFDNIQFIFNTTAGISLFPEHASSAAELINKARLTHAARDWGDTTALFTSSIAERSQRQSLLQERFESALVDGSLYFHWQPIFDNYNRALVAFELLARWYDPQLGAISPGEFIPLIDRQERLRRALVVKAAQTACEQLARWQTTMRKPPHVAINIPGSEFYRDDFPDLIGSILARHAVAGSQLMLELTERSLIPDFATTAETMRRLRQFGVPIAIDDFGSGYSSITYLTELPISLVKIDKSVVQQIDRSAQRYRLMQSIVDLAHGQNLPTVAEGVETQAQLDLVADMHCEYTQGFFLGRPQPLEQANALVESHNT